MTNQEIVQYVYDNIDIKKLVKHNIYNSINDGSYEELTQYIYQELMLTNNEKLNTLYNNKAFNFYIVRIITNQRNEKRSNYNRYLRLEDIDDPDPQTFYEDDTLMDEKIEKDRQKGFITDTLINFFMNTTYTGKTEKDKFISINLLAMNKGVEICNNELKIVKKMSLKYIAENYIDEKLNKNKLKTKTYLVKKYISLGSELLKMALQKNNDLIV